MTAKPPPPPLSPSPYTFQSTRSLTFHWPSPSPPPFHAVSACFAAATKPSQHPCRVQSTDRHTESDPSIPTGAASMEDDDRRLLSLLRQRKTEEAWDAYTQCTTHLPNPTCLSRLVSQLSYQNTHHSLSRAQSLVHRLDANSLGLFAVAAAKSGHVLYAASVVKSMLRSGYLPHVKAWSAVVSRLAASPDYGQTPPRHRPDTGAFNAALNACANLGDAQQFLKLFDEMPVSGVSPDVLTFNVMIKLCARAGRKDLLVFVLEMILDVGIEPCITTILSLVAAYVGFGDLNIAEKIVQALREGRRDLCKLLREESRDSDADAGAGGDVFMKLLPNYSRSDVGEPPLLPRPYAPNSRLYTTLMKGYMKAGRVSDTLRVLEAMRRQEDSGSHPDHVTYTTVVSALVREGSMDHARHVLAQMTRIGVPASRITYNILLKGYCQQLKVDRAKALLREMAEDAGIQPDVVSYNTLIDGCILADDSAGALASFNEMRARGIAPSKVSYTTLMKAFALSGQPKLAHKVFDEMMADPRVKADVAAWNMLVEGYSRPGLIVEAKKVVERMKEEGLYPNVATYGSLANGIAVARKPGEALLLWKEIKERCEAERREGSGRLPALKPDEGLLDALAEICVRAAFFRKALEIVACMEELGVAANKNKFSKIYVEMHSKMFSSKHASRARQDRRRERKRAAEAFKFWLGLPNSYYGSEWRLEPQNGEDDDSV